MKRGDIVLIRFPFSDLSSNKVRPALVVSSDEYMQRCSDAIFVCISSKNTSKLYPTDLLIENTDSEFRATGLKKSSLIRIDKIVILKTSLVRRSLGYAGPNIMSQVDKTLTEVLGLEIVPQNNSQDIQKEQASQITDSPPSENTI